MLSLCMLYCLFGCGETPPEQAEEPVSAAEETSAEPELTEEIIIPDSPKGVDRTVPFDGIDIRGKEIAVTGKGTIGIGTSYVTARSLVPDSGYIVRGTVIRVTYANRDGNAMILYDVQLAEVWADRVHPAEQSLGAGDCITVFQSGGYLPGDVFEEYHRSGLNLTADQLVLQNIADIPFPEEGDEYVLFLTDYPEPELAGVYTVTGIYQGRYEIEGETASRFYPEETAPYQDNGAAVEELKAAVLDALENNRPEPPLTLEAVLENYLTQLRSVLESEKKTLNETEGEEDGTFLSGVVEGHEKQIEQLPAFYERVLSRADAIAAETEENPSVLLLSGTTPEKAYCSGSFAALLIERAGAVNAAGAYSSAVGEEAAVTAEQIAEMDPDIIVIYSSVFKDYYTAEDVLSRPEWQAVGAVKNGRVYEADVIGPWFSAGEQNADPYGWMGVAYLQTLLAPEAYSEEQFQEDAREFLELMGDAEGFERRFGAG